MHVLIVQKNCFVKNVWPANWVLFIYIPTHYVKKNKELDFNRYLQLTRLARGNAPDCGARDPGFNSRLWQGFVCFVVVVILLFVQKYIIHKIYRRLGAKLL